MSNFLFPIETTARELDQKIYMAILSSKKGRKIYIGDQQFVRILSYFLKCGVFYGKHLFGKPKFSDMGYYKRLKKRGFNVVHLNEEGAVWPGKEDDWKNILEQAERPSKLDKTDFLATWGEWQKKTNIEREPTHASIKATGHPRFDLYSKKFRKYFDEDVNKIVAEYGDYILVNTAFSYSNNGEKGVQFIFKPTLSYDTSNLEHRKYRFKRWKQQMFSMASIVDLVNKLSMAMPDKKIVLRPHPSESTSYYKAIFQNIDNVYVIYKGAVGPWIMGCQVLIHNGCTTAIEATLSGKAVLNYATNSDPDFDVFLANICGVTISNESEAIDYVLRVFENKTKINMPDNALADSLFCNFKNAETGYDVLTLLEEADKKNCCDKVKSLDNTTLPLLSLINILYLCSKYFYLTLKGRFRDFVDYRKRFETFHHDDLDRKINLMSSILGKRVKITYFSSRLFVLESD